MSKHEAHKDANIVVTIKNTIFFTSYFKTTRLFLCDFYNLCLLKKDNKSHRIMLQTVNIEKFLIQFKSKLSSHYVSNFKKIWVVLHYFYKRHLLKNMVSKRGLVPFEWSEYKNSGFKATYYDLTKWSDLSFLEIPTFLWWLSYVIIRENNKWKKGV